MGIRGVFSKWSNCQPSFFSVLLMGMFAMEINFGSCTKVKVNVAFRAGSSKQGNVLRASVGWNWVAAIVLQWKWHKFLLSNNRSFYSQCVLSVLAFEQKRSKGDLVTNLLVFNNVNAWLSSSNMRITQFAHEMQHLQPHLFIYLSRVQAHSCKMAY